jgi:hypothetical protein
MTNICCGDYHVRGPKCHGLRCENHITVQRLVIGSRSTPLTSLSPKYGGLPHGRRGEGQILQQVSKGVEARKPSRFIRTQ